MPYLSITLSVEPFETTRDALLVEASKIVAEALEKPEEFVQVACWSAGMIFGGDSAPSAHLELAVIGTLEATTNARITAKLCALLEERLEVPPERVFVRFREVDRADWGWNRGTFALPAPAGA